jgi:hypothetical protein
MKLNTHNQQNENKLHTKGKNQPFAPSHSQMLETVVTLSGYLLYMLPTLLPHKFQLKLEHFQQQPTFKLCRITTRNHGFSKGST